VDWGRVEWIGLGLRVEWIGLGLSGLGERKGKDKSLSRMKWLTTVMLLCELDGSCNK